MATDAKKKKVCPRKFLSSSPRKGKTYSVDLRVHTPGTYGYFTAGGIEPGPALCRLAKVKGLDVIGFSDFYDPAVAKKIANIPEDGLKVIPGIDINCLIGECAQIQVTCLFPDTVTEEDLDLLLRKLKVPLSATGDRDYLIEKDFGEIIALVEALSGIAIPSRIDQTPQTMMAVPALVEEYGITAFDLVNQASQEYFKENWPEGGFTFLAFSNALSLAQIGNRSTSIKLEEPGFAGLRSRLSRVVEATA